MPLHSIDIISLRETCRSRIESLERWMRRIIWEELTGQYGEDFVNFRDSYENFLVSADIRKSINNRYSTSQDQFPRPIDAAFFENLTAIFCSPPLYNAFFKRYLNSFFPSTMPNGYIYLRFCLDRVKDIRNNLSHANSISIRDGEYILSFTTEIVESFKNLYRMEGKQQEYNVPQIIRVIDSFGNVCIRKDFSTFEHFVFTNSENCFLRPGDVLSIEVEVDSSYDQSDYQMQFIGADEVYRTSNKLIYTMQKSDVTPSKAIVCQLRSNKDWHKYQNLDDQVTLIYKVLPPLA